MPKITPTDLNQYWRRYSPVETIYLQKHGDAGKLMYDNTGRNAQQALESASLFEDEQFLRSGEALGILRQERFIPVDSHKHNYIELLYIWSGECVQSINGQRHVLRKGDICIFDMQTVHACERIGENDILLNIIMNKKFFQTAFFSRLTRHSMVAEFLMNAISDKKIRQRYLMFPADDDPEIHRVISQLCCEYINHDLGYKSVVESMAVVLFTELLRRYNRSRQNKITDTPGNHLPDILLYMEQNDHAALTEVAEHFGYHPNYLTTLLKETTGKTFLQHIQAQRMLKAEAMLRDSDLSVETIAQACGYNNLHFFYQKFYEAHSCTPGAYRKLGIKS